MFVVSRFSFWHTYSFFVDTPSDVAGSMHSILRHDSHEYPRPSRLDACGDVPDEGLHILGAADRFFALDFLYS